MNDEKNQPDELLADELRNFRDLAAFLKGSPGGIPRIDGIDIAGFSMPLRGTIGGDHLIYIDFNRRYNLEHRMSRARAKGRLEVAEKLEQLKHRAGILVADVSGHRMTDALIAAMLHQAFLLGAYYELDHYGEITTRIFEHLNNRFYRTNVINKYFTMIYGEISSEGQFRFISAGHQPPAIFSREFAKFVRISPDRLVSFAPVGMLPPKYDPDDPIESVMKGKERYEINELSLLNRGDILLLFTDGLAEHDDDRFFPQRVETLLRECPGCSSAEICERLKQQIEECAAPQDDITVVVIQRTH